MRKIDRGYWFEFIAVVIGGLTTVGGLLLRRFSEVDVPLYLVFLPTILSVQLGIFFISIKKSTIDRLDPVKSDIVNHLKPHLSSLREDISNSVTMLSLMGQIEDPENRISARLAVSDCIRKLEELKNGTVQIGEVEYFGAIIKEMDRVPSGGIVLATHVAWDLQYMFDWEDVPGIIQYYEANQRAVERGVRIERIFLLNRSDVIFEDRDGAFRAKEPRVFDIMERQRQDRIEVSVTWIESLEDSRDHMVEDFIIFNYDTVIVSEPRAGARYPSFRKQDGRVIQEKRTKFTNLKHHGHPLPYVLNQVGNYLVC